MAARAPRQRSLFGGFAPPVKDPRGRKQIAYDAQVAEFVRDLRALGATVELIASEVGLSDKTLKRIYSSELAAADKAARLELGLAAIKKARTGHTPSIRLALELLDKGGAAIPIATPAALRDATTEKLGKKAQATVDAQTAHEGTTWGGLLQ